MQALGVIILGIVLSGFLPRIALVGGFGFNPGNGAVGLGLAVAAFSPKRPSKRELRRKGGDRPSE